jgi:hypothetical protein
MTIRNQPEPTGGRDIIHAALSARLPQTRSLRAAKVGAVQTGHPLPVYVLTRQDAQLPDPLARATLAGWSYPIVGGQEPGLASLSGTPDTPHFSGTTEGSLPQRLLEAAELAERQLADDPEVYEPRLLDMPALRMFCLWLKGPRDRFVQLLGGQPAGSAPLTMENDIGPAIHAALAASAVRTPTPGEGPPTN